MMVKKHTHILLDLRYRGRREELLPRQLHIVCGMNLQFPKLRALYLHMIRLTLDSRVILVNEVALNELNSQSRFPNTCTKSVTYN